MSRSKNSKHPFKAPSTFKKARRRQRRAKEHSSLAKIVNGKTVELPRFRKNDTYDYF